MARKLKVFTTSAGFFDLAVSAPSMKAALEAWGAGANLFHQGFAQQTDDPAVVKATMARPGVVLRRPVGTDQPFQEEAEASEASFQDKVARKPRAARPRRKPVPAKATDPKQERAAAIAFEKERERRERQEAAARRKEAARRDRAIADATAALEKAEARHEATAAEIEEARAALDAKADREARRWRREREKLEEALPQARVPRHLRPV